MPQCKIQKVPLNLNGQAIVTYKSHNGRIYLLLKGLKLLVAMELSQPLVIFIDFQEIIQGWLK